MVSVEEAATLAGVSQRAIFRWTEERRLHFVETPNGPLQICLNSVIEQIRGNKTADRNDED
jgi:predicted site-specific integrase-resolvase